MSATGRGETKLAKVLTWTGRTLGIVYQLLFIVIMIITPPSEWAIFILLGCIILFAIFAGFLAVAWRREFIGGTLYLGFITLAALLISISPGMDWGWEYLPLLLPSFVIAVLFLASGLLKQGVDVGVTRGKYENNKT